MGMGLWGLTHTCVLVCMYMYVLCVIKVLKDMERRWVYGV
jgi:hypothetical protein